MIFLDTSYFVGLAMGQDALHGRAGAWSAHLPGPFLTTGVRALGVREFAVCADESCQGTRDVGAHRGQSEHRDCMGRVGTVSVRLGHAR